MSEELEPCKGCGHPECNVREMHERVHASIWEKDGPGRQEDIGFPRPQVMKLAFLMEQKLRRDDSTKPDWNQENIISLRAGLRRELEELTMELLKLSREDDICLGQMSAIPNAKAIALECADAANYLMFIADKVGGLE